MWKFDYHIIKEILNRLSLMGYWIRILIILISAILDNMNIYHRLNTIVLYINLQSFIIFGCIFEMLEIYENLKWWYQKCIWEGKYNYVSYLQHFASYRIWKWCAIWICFISILKRNFRRNLLWSKLKFKDSILRKTSPNHFPCLRL